MSSSQPDELSELLIALTDGDINQRQFVHLQNLLSQDADAQTYFRQYMRLCALLEFERATAKDEQSELRGDGNGNSAAGISGFSGLESPLPNPPFPTLSTTNYPLPTSHFSVGSWAFSCMVATVIMGVMLLVFWAMKVTHHQHIAEAPAQSAPSDVRPEMVFVGRITGMLDVQWSDDPRYLPPPDFAHVPLDRKYKLDSGLLEITYDSGAKVILQGPCTYEVESRTGGYLALGKLTARVEKRSEGRGAREEKGSRFKVQGSNSKPEPSSFILHPSSLFSVRTPTAVITDLGTEFAVEVDKAGTSKTHVFQGKVEVRLSGNKADVRAIRLGAGESARVGPDRDQVIRIIRGTSENAQPLGFTRRMPEWVPIELFNTGVGLKEGAPDPHWQLVARSDDPDFQPRPALVTAAHVYWLANYPARSQWLSTADGPPAVPNVTYTFCTTFKLLTNMLPETAVLRGRFIADNHVQAIRLNGKEVPVSEHGWGRLGGGIFSDGDAFNLFSEFSARKGFVEGANTLEIDVHNGIPPETGGNGAMGLRVELSGHVLSSWQSGGRGQPPRKEDTSMNGP